MAQVSVIRPPSCGLYRTTRPLPGDDAVGAGMLVNFHDHDYGEVRGPVVHLPKFIAFNRWEWEKTPHRVQPLSWVESLQPLLPEGFYVLREDLVFADRKGDATWPRTSLVQLGYDRAGTPIVFLAQRKHQAAENTLFFAEKGVPLTASQLDLLMQLVVYEEPDPNAAGGEATHVGGIRDKTGDLKTP